MAKYNYKAIDIFNKEFKVKMRGFDPDEVDEFLDNIMKDYETFNKEILALQEENDRLNAKINQLNKSQAVMSKIQPESQKSQTVTNFDILKRLSNLEKEVFGKKLDQEVTIEPSPSLSSLSANYTNNDDEDDLDKTRLF
ncbi:cell division regulator GpsB [Enterococcus cecorum]|uniref:Cell division protein DivIVA n=1 Tax=Enterococcus cecorum TaxID=44008 RepID=A0A1Y4R2T5_9ENTE|nr:cell division regulator GpsB [Enterococcus cecorum]OUQ11878.1 cell division protein DivIVA [Enterococcus cecorum]CAI3251867.1 cell division regulator GpsB [Enterococcus cecorum]CAI3252337.1 cell division regulator GpsB [Enterococcus cecorum]CAI3253152.1 cell division regulator GpsB [Enterococcus cecorum]CAI3257915.1 cell division regulator GpsB [Enterococcus cecorum]